MVTLDLNTSGSSATNINPVVVVWNKTGKAAATKHGVATRGAGPDIQCQPPTSKGYRNCALRILHLTASGTAHPIACQTFLTTF